MEPGLSWDEGCAKVFMTRQALSALPVTMEYFPAISVYTDMYKTTWPPALLAQNLGNIDAVVLAQTTCFLLPGLSFPIPCSLLSRIGEGTQNKE